MVLHNAQNVIGCDKSVAKQSPDQLAFMHRQARHLGQRPFPFTQKIASEPNSSGKQQRDQYAVCKNRANG